MLLLYRDDPKYSTYLTNIVDKYDSYAYIIHDKDIIEDTGELKKEHMHVVIYFKNKKELSELAKEVTIPENYIKVWDKKTKALRYLIHADHLDKAQYSTSLVSGTLKPDLIRLINQGYELEHITEILDYIDSDRNISWKQLTRWILSKGYYAEFRRSQGIIRDYYRN